MQASWVIAKDLVGHSALVTHTSIGLKVYLNVRSIEVVVPFAYIKLESGYIQTMRVEDYGYTKEIDDYVQNVELFTGTDVHIYAADTDWVKEFGNAPSRLEEIAALLNTLSPESAEYASLVQEYEGYTNGNH